MSRRPDPVMVALADQITATLRDLYPRDVATMALCDKLGVNRYDAIGVRVYTILRRLNQRGQVEAISHSNGHAFWRLRRDPEDDEVSRLLAGFEQGTGPS